MIVAVLPPGIDRGQKLCPVRRQFSPIRRRGTIRPMDDRCGEASHVRDPSCRCRGRETPFRAAVPLVITSLFECSQCITDSNKPAVCCPIAPNTFVVFFYEQGRMDDNRGEVRGFIQAVDGECCAMNAVLTFDSARGRRMSGTELSRGAIGPGGSKVIPFRSVPAAVV